MSTDQLLESPSTALATAMAEAPSTSLPRETMQLMARAAQGAEVDEADDEAGLRGASFTEWIRGGSACFVSMAFHILALVALALVGLEQSQSSQVQTILASPVVERPEDEPVDIELAQEIKIIESSNVSLASSAPSMAGVGTGDAATVGTPTLDQRVVAEADVPVNNIAIEAPTLGMPSANKLIQAVPDGEVKGDPRALVGDYQQALDRISQELMWMLDKGPVMAVWVFDESESMKDDQQEIRDRIHNVYRQLGVYGRATSEALLTGVVSYGDKYRIHLRPTGNGDEIKKAIDNIPIDPSGKEMMCQAVGQAIRDFRKQATRGRQMAMILVTDESGERDNNDRFLEAAISEAKSANCKIFVLGREAIFGYPYAYISWRHPTTRRVHWLQIDRGPESGFPEQLQTNGLQRRYDAFSSGFGPYEQSRMARETNGVFFMLPSVENNLVGAQKHSYGVESMRPFRPDLRARAEVFSDREKFPLRALIWKVISDLNPWNPQVGNKVELAVDFSTNPQKLVQQIRTNQQKAIQLLRYLADAQKGLEQGTKFRDQEADPRWQANYDLIYGQIISYQARIYEYGAGLEPYTSKPPFAPATKSPNLVLVNWDVSTRKEALTKESKPYIEKSMKLLQEIVEAFPGTPWSARAQWELSRGFGVHLVPDYQELIVNDPKAIPPPKL